MAYVCYDVQGANGWKQRITREQAQHETFMRNAARKRMMKGDDDASSIVSSYASGKTSSTMNTLVLKDRLKNLETQLLEERMKRQALESELSTIRAPKQT
mmetsp:Transcript_13661/g.35089  ORF Transcript_13661/g.35089 Transcript_13661/m.35089 type:complete len:100 (+) Transcript_13661:173-472(+)|eukprot:jgi/Tetstr1/429657/TSEL_019554.t1